MRSILKIIWVSSVLVLLFSCGGPGKETSSESKDLQEEEVRTTNEQAPFQEIITGVLVKDVVCRDHPGTSYSIYIPEKPDNNAPFPVIFCFDPHARGWLPVEKYKSLADELGFVLVGSNNSKNGLPMEEAGAIFRYMLNDLSMQINIDKNRISTLGFSGGGRIAAWLAGQNEKINSVISCGAGLPPKMYITTLDFNYLVLIGNQDFNYSEIWKISSVPQGDEKPMDYLVFDGKHEWPPEELMGEAFLWILMNDMKRGLVNKDNVLVQSVGMKFTEDIGNLTEEGNIFIAAEQLKLTVRMLDGLAELSTYHEVLDQLLADPAYMQQKEQIEEVFQLEYREQNKLLSAFTAMDLDWWEAALQQITSDKGNLGQNNMNHRLMGWLGLVAYLSADRALGKMQADVSEKFIALYKLFEPENPEHAYMQARLDMLNDQPEKAIQSLKQSVRLGFDDKERLFNEPAFVNLHAEDDFQGLLSY